jgi:hypothetical protein
MSRAITDPTSNYRPEDALLSVEGFIASYGMIGEAELCVFFKGLSGCEYRDPSIIDDPARLLFLASLTLKLCQRSNVSIPKIFSLFIQAGGSGFRDKVRLLRILPLLRSLSSKTVPPGYNTAVRTLHTDLTNELSPDLDAFIEAFGSALDAWRNVLNEDNYRIVSILSLLTTLGHSHLVADRIVRRSGASNVRLLRSAFQYYDEHGE